MANLHPNIPKICGSSLIELFDIDSPRSDTLIERIIYHHAYCRSLQIICQNDVLDIVKNIVTDNVDFGFVHIENLPVYRLIEPEFLDNFIANGILYGVSVDADVNIDETMAILPNKKILLSLNQYTYHRLGIVGQPSTLNRKHLPTAKYRLCIDLSDPAFKPDKKLYQRTYECLSRSRLQFNAVLKWHPKKSNVSPNSLENYFRTKLESSSIRRGYVSVQAFCNRNQPLFDLQKTFFASESSRKDFWPFIEWCQAQMARVKCLSNDYEISTFEVPDQDCRMDQTADIYCVQLDGFLTSPNVHCLLQRLRQESSFTDSANAIIVHGFYDSPQCWTGTNNEHYKNLAGENVYGLSFFPGPQKALIWSMTDQFDFGLEKLANFPDWWHQIRNTWAN